MFCGRARWLSGSQPCSRVARGQTPLPWEIFSVWTRGLIGRRYWQTLEVADARDAVTATAGFRAEAKKTLTLPARGSVSVE